MADGAELKTNEMPATSAEADAVYRFVDSEMQKAEGLIKATDKKVKDADGTITLEQKTKLRDELEKISEVVQNLNFLRRLYILHEDIQKEFIEKLRQMAMDGNMDAFRLLEKALYPRVKKESATAIAQLQNVSFTRPPIAITDMNAIMEEVTKLNKYSFENIPDKEAKQLLEKGVTTQPELKENSNAAK